MRLLFFFCFFSFLAFQNTVSAQQIEVKDLRKAMTKWQKKAADTIQIQRKESERLRQEMRSIVKELNYEPMFIFGPKDAWILEDMNLLFEKPPVPFGVGMERAKLQVTLEKNNIMLYWADLRLYRWKKIKYTLDSIAILEKPSEEWVGYTYEGEVVEKKSEKEKNRLANQFISNNLWGKYASFFPEGNFLNPDVKKQQPTAKKEKKEQLPSDVADFSTYAKESYPAQGQFNFYINEDLRHKGFVYFSQDSFSKHLKFLLYSDEWTCKIVWEDNKNYRKEEAIKNNDGWSSPAGFDFLIPLDLKKATFYHVAIIATKNENGEKKEEKKIVWQNYFRTSKYELTEKLEKFAAQRPIYDKIKGSFSVTTDEPFDKVEIGARNKAGRKLLQISSDDGYSQSPDYYVRSGELYYFLETPTITPVDTTDLTNTPLAELDNTASEAFMQNLSSGAFNDSDKERFADSWQDTIKMGKLLILRKNYLEKDTIIGKYTAPEITKKDFEAGKIKLPKNFQYDIYVTSMKQQAELCELINAAINERIIARSHFFYQLALRAWKRKPIGKRPNLSDYQAKEVEGLLPKVKAVRNYLATTPPTIKVNVVKTDPIERLLAIRKMEVFR